MSRSVEISSRLSMTLAAGLSAMALAAAVVVGCAGSESDGAGCDAAAGACQPLGGTCSASSECASASCSGGRCVEAGCEGSECAPVGSAGSFGGSFFVDNLDPPLGGTGGAGGSEPSCVDLDVDFQRITPTVVLLIDQSGSMDQAFEDGLDRWETLVRTLGDAEESLIKRLESSVRFGMSLYTSDGGFGSGTPRECPILTSVDIALGNFSELSELLSENEPGGDTPTAESMEIVAAQLRDFESDGPKSIILATDGDPDTCEDPDANNSDASKARSVAAVADAYASGITTHVISVGNEVTQSHLEALAVAGKGGDTSAEAYTALDTDGLVDAFNAIISSVRTCDFNLEGTVERDDAARGRVILDGRELAFGDANGWEMPDESTVRLLGEACQAVQADASGITMRFPCDAIQILPH